MYAQEVKRMWLAGLDYNDGSLLASRVRVTVYDCLLSNISIGPDGLRDRNYDLSFFDPDEGKFKVLFRCQKAGAVSFVGFFIVLGHAELHSNFGWCLCFCMVTTAALAQ